MPGAITVVLNCNHNSCSFCRFYPSCQTAQPMICTCELCYLPLDWRSRDEIKDDRLIVGNEVVFDDLDSFRKALASDVLIEVEKDDENFKPWSYSSHHAMHRTLVYSREQD